MTTTYKKIMDEAYISFAINGYEQTSLSKLAKKIGISKPAFYYHFASKESLFEVLYELIVKEIRNSYNRNFDELKKEDVIGTIIEIGLDGIKYQKEDEHLGPVLLQFYLLSIRNKKFEKISDELSKIELNKYKSILEVASKYKIIDTSEIEYYSKLLKMIDSSISEEMIVNKKYDYESFFRKFILKIF